MYGAIQKVQLIMENLVYENQTITDQCNSLEKKGEADHCTSVTLGMKVTSLKTERLELLSALKSAKKTIKIWHGDEECHPLKVSTWELYQQSPEMKIINEAIKNAEK